MEEIKDTIKGEIKVIIKVEIFLKINFRNENFIREITSTTTKGVHPIDPPIKAQINMKEPPSLRTP